MKKIVAAAAIVLAMGGSAQAFPDKPVQLVVPFSPGGGTDVLARLVGQRLSEELGQQVVIDNRGGAGGSIGAAHAAAAKPDGYTLLIFNALPHTSAPNLYENLTYDPVTDFQPIGTFGVSPYVLVVNPEFPAQDYAAFIDLIHAAPGQYDYASAGVGSATHLAMEFFKQAADLDIQHIPYNGSGPALNDVVAGNVPVALDSVLAVTELARSGLLTPLAISSEQRSATFPEVPTFAELGQPDLGLVGNWGLVAPKGTPAEIIEILNKALAATIADPQISAQLNEQGITPSVSSPEDFEALLHAESAKWRSVISAIDIQL